MRGLHFTLFPHVNMFGSHPLFPPTWTIESQTGCDLVVKLPLAAVHFLSLEMKYQPGDTTHSHHRKKERKKDQCIRVILAVTFNPILCPWYRVPRGVISCGYTIYQNVWIVKISKGQNRENVCGFSSLEKLTLWKDWISQSPRRCRQLSYVYYSMGTI